MMERGEITTKLDLITDELAKLIPRDLLERECFFAGGCIRSMVRGEKVNDYDLFVRTPEALVKIKEHLELYCIYNSKNSMGIVRRLIDDELCTAETIEIQLIVCATGSPDHIIGEFDFTNNMNYYDLSNKYLSVNASTAFPELGVNPKCRNVLGTLARIPKFVERGYSMPSSQDMVTLGIRASKMSPITKVSELAENCRIQGCLTEEVIDNNELDRDYDYYSSPITFRGSGA